MRGFMIGGTHNWGLTVRELTFAGILLKIPSIRKTGALISKKHSMGLAMQSNILGAIPTRLLSLTAGSFLSRIHIQHSAHVAEFPVIPVVTITLRNEVFIRRFLMHVLPTGFQKIRYYGFLNNRMKSKNLKFKQRYASLGMADLMKRIWKKDICCCPQCRHSAMRLLGRTHGAFG